MKPRGCKNNLMERTRPEAETETRAYIIIKKQINRALKVIENFCKFEVPR